MSIADVVQRADTRAGRAFDLCIIVLIVLSIVSLTIETLPGIAPSFRAALQLSEIVITVLFTAEYFLRVYTAPSKLGYIFSFYGIIDLLAIVPFYLALGFDLRGLRAFRIFRVFRILKLTRYNRAMQRFHRALVLAKEELVLFFITTAILLYLAAFGIYYFEHQAQPEHFKSILHSIWWATTTLTTVGYGDIYPITAGGRTFTFLVLMIGLGVIAVPPGLVASALSKAREQEIGADET
ncbi:ion transporter [Oceanococcus atlanticus]|uniref:Ion transporter n=1 Tax=Oceanococcus atlanticus TaxID=1317117 RepID=A0A1Y1S9T7_9GAMM|nr:ion transporter [Oceanococcus atlanticus]ORE84961.1 ion transporter [Oceanococcus atlanticus]